MSATCACSSTEKIFINNDSPSHINIVDAAWFAHCPPAALLSRRRSITLLSSRRLLGCLIILPKPLRLPIVLPQLGFLIVLSTLALLIVPATAWLPYYPPEAAPFAHCPSAARFPYCPPDFISLNTSNFASGHHTIRAASISQARRNARSD